MASHPRTRIPCSTPRSSIHTIDNMPLPRIYLRAHSLIQNPTAVLAAAGVITARIPRMLVRNRARCMTAATSRKKARRRAVRLTFTIPIRVRNHAQHAHIFVHTTYTLFSVPVCAPLSLTANNSHHSHMHMHIRMHMYNLIPIPTQSLT